MTLYMYIDSGQIVEQELGARIIHMRSELLQIERKIGQLKGERAILQAQLEYLEATGERE